MKYAPTGPYSNTKIGTGVIEDYRDLYLSEDRLQQFRYQLHLIPASSPLAGAFTWTTDRLLTKTRALQIQSQRNRPQKAPHLCLKEYNKTTIPLHA